MPTHREKRVLPYSPAQMFDLVADIESYPEFLPWCSGARIKSRDGDNLVADLDVGFGPFSETFTSRVTLVRPERIDVEHERGPFRHLVNHWHFAPHGDGDGGGECEIDFAIAFEFRSAMLERMIGAMFHRAFEKMVGSFERRAAELYARPDHNAA